jgi:hypothetical protein
VFIKVFATLSGCIRIIANHHLSRRRMPPRKKNKIDSAPTVFIIRHNSTTLGLIRLRNNRVSRKQGLGTMLLEYFAFTLPHGVSYFHHDLKSLGSNNKHNTTG